jgi:voltage-gated potassium channel Kch
MAGDMGWTGWRSGRSVAGAAGIFLLWRGIFGRGPGGFFLVLAGAAILRRVLGAGGARRARAATAATASARRSPEVIEVKSPAELEPGVASASARPTFSNRVDRPRDPPVSGGPVGVGRR